VLDLGSSGRLRGQGRPCKSRKRAAWKAKQFAPADTAVAKTSRPRRQNSSGFDAAELSAYNPQLLFCVQVLAMDYLNQLATHYEGLFNVIGSIVGIAGFIFGTWRYLRERQAQRALERRERELNEAHSRLKRLQDYASGIKTYSAAV
jgi:hypothetical protein